MTWKIGAVLVGRVVPFGKKGEPSAIAKAPTSDAVAVNYLGLGGDQQADLVHHGGPDKAIHHYPLDHYPYWRQELGSVPLLDQAGAFGENISTVGLVEAEVCIGDRFRMGTALVEVSQGRQPCWKLGHRFGESSVPANVVRSGKSGWYYRVIEEGEVRCGNDLQLVERPFPEWTTERVFSLLIAGNARHEPEATRELSKLEPLASNWRERAVKLSG